MLCVRQIDERGRGLFILRDLPEGCEVIRGYVSLIEREHFDNNPIGNFPLAWDDTHHALVWSAISLINHSDAPNVRVERDEQHLLIRMVATRDIKKGEEITYDYKCPLWFEPKPPAQLTFKENDNGTSD